MHTHGLPVTHAQGSCMRFTRLVGWTERAPDLFEQRAVLRDTMLNSAEQLLHLLTRHLSRRCDAWFWVGRCDTAQRNSPLPLFFTLASPSLLSLLLRNSYQNQRPASTAAVPDTRKEHVGRRVLSRNFACVRELPAASLP